MQGTFEKLQRLQEILSKKFEIEREISEIPKKLATKKEILSRLKKSYIEKNEEFEGKKERIKHLKHTMIDAETKREDHEKKMDLISTQREYEALDKEIKDASDEEQRIRREIQKEERLLDEMQGGLSREEQMIELQETELDEETRQVEEESQLKKEELKALEIEEKKVSPGMDEEILYKFERILRNKEGLGIVPVINTVCTGCHMVLPAQFVNNVRAGDEVLFCPYCSRILFFSEDTGEQITGSETDTEPEQMGGLADLVDDEIDLEDI